MHNKDKKVNKKVPIQKQIEETLQQASTIETVNVSPFFKDKVMHQLSKEKEVAVPEVTWFTPKLQLATLVVVLVINVFAFSNLSFSTYDDNITEFAQSYELSTTSDTSYFNE